MAKTTVLEKDGQPTLLPTRESCVRWMRDELHGRLRAGVMQLIEDLFEEECRDLCGEAWTRKQSGQARRGGTERGSVHLDGRRVPVSYPRVAGKAGSKAIQGYQALRDYDLLGQEVLGKLLRGVSTRDYAEVVGQIVEGTGLKRSVVSRAFVRASQKQLDEINGRDLSSHVFVAIYLDGVQLGESTLVIGMGVTQEGRKVFLGVREGHTENATVVGELLENLVERKLTLTDRFLAVIDGSKALRAALVRRWTGRVEIQRCQEHKKRNVLDYLPKDRQNEAKRRMNVAWGLSNYEEAKKNLEQTAKWLRTVSEDAATSLEEGLEETLTVVRLGLPALLRRTFRSTNPLESTLDSVRYRTHRVKRWRPGQGQMAARWAASALMLTEKRLHKIRGHGLMATMLEKLKDMSQANPRSVGA